MTPIFIHDADLGEMTHEEIKTEERKPDVKEVSKNKVIEFDTDQTLKLHNVGDTTMSLDLGHLVPTETS